MRVFSGSWVVLLLCAACSADPSSLEPGPAAGGTGGSGGSGGAPSAGSGTIVTLGATAGTLTFSEPPLDVGAKCDPNRTVDADSAALLVRDPEVLARFGLERVLRQIATTAAVEIEPLELLQRLFDNDNADADAVFADALHCDSPDNFAFSSAKAVDCPRAEGRLASSPDLLQPDAADGFVPIAIVNRFDLLPSDFSSCGEQRIVYAKVSGRTNPDDRAFLIFEAALFNQSRSLASCRRVAELWAGLASATPTERAEKLENFFFLGLPGFSPVVHAAHYGLGSDNCFYSGACGQVRLAQGMQAPWQFRQFRVMRRDSEGAASRLFFGQTTVAGALQPQLFDSASDVSGLFPGDSGFGTDLSSLVATDVNQIRLRTRSEYEAGESAVAGAAAPDYAAHVSAAPNDALQASLADDVARLPAHACPEGDGFTAASILQRAAAVTCAGCHAPEQVLSDERKLGCGTVWPPTLGQTHIDEQGELSPALKEVFLPARALIFQIFLQGCDAAAIRANLQPVPPDPPHAECFPAGTAITLPNGQTRPIEQLNEGDWVLSYEPSTQTLLPARVAQRIVRPRADSFVRINGELLATDNHPFYADGRWVQAGELEVGAQLLQAHDADSTAGVALQLMPVRVSELAASTGPVTTYNLIIDGQHSYFAGGLLVHDRP